MTTANVVTNNVVKTKVFLTKMDKISSFFTKKRPTSTPSCGFPYSPTGDNLALSSNTPHKAR